MDSTNKSPSELPEPTLDETFSVWNGFKWVTWEQWEEERLCRIFPDRARRKQWGSKYGKIAAGGRRVDG